MWHHPFAETLYKAFMDKFYGPKDENGKRDKSGIKYDERTPLERNKNTVENMLRHARLKKLELGLNKFIKNSGKTVKFPENVDEESVLKFVNLISGYCGIDQKAISKMTSAYSKDPDLIELYGTAAEYAKAFSLDGLISRYLYADKEYQMSEIVNPNNLAEATFLDDTKIIPGKETLVLGMSFSIKPTEEEMQKWSDKFLHQVVDDKDFFGKDKDTSVFLSFSHIATPRGDKFGLVFRTLANPDYFSPKDMRYVKEDFMQLLGTDIELDKNHKVIKGKPYSKEQFEDNMKKLNFFSYCFGASCTHRFINAMHHVAKQLYGKETADSAMKKINVVTYGFLPVSDKLKYSCISLISNYTDDYLRAEPMARTFKPELYEQVKCQDEEKGFKITSLGEKNHVIAFALDEDTEIRGENGTVMAGSKLEKGHTIALVTQNHLGKNYTMSFDAVQFLLKEISKQHDDADLIVKKLATKLEARQKLNTEQKDASKQQTMPIKDNGRVM